MEYAAPEVIMHADDCAKNINLAKVDKDTAMMHAVNKLKNVETFSMLYLELVKFKDMFWI